MLARHVTVHKICNLWAGHSAIYLARFLPGSVAKLVEHMSTMQGDMDSNPGGIWQFSTLFHVTFLT